MKKKEMAFVIVLAVLIILGSASRESRIESTKLTPYISGESGVPLNINDTVKETKTLDTEQLLQQELEKYNKLPTYYGQEPYRNLSYFATVTYNSGTYLESCATTSMYPTFTCSDILLIVPARNYNLSVGDIVIFSASFWNDSHGTQYIIHRIIEMGNDDLGKYYVTKGDYNVYPDNAKLRDRYITWVVAGKWVK